MKRISRHPWWSRNKASESADAPYFVDLVNEQLADEFQDHDFQAVGFQDLHDDRSRSATRRFRGGRPGLARSRDHSREASQTRNPDRRSTSSVDRLDPHTGEIKALIGGKNYGLSQVNHVVAKRPSGSVFKPFVYAAALNTGFWTARTQSPRQPHLRINRARLSTTEKRMSRGTITVTIGKEA